MLARAEIDVAITYDMEIPKDVAFEKVISLPPYVMLPADHYLAANGSVYLKELQDEPMILLDLPISREYFMSVVQSSIIKPTILERSSDLSVVRSLVANRYGFSIVNMRTKSDLAPDGEKLAFLRLADDIRPLILGLATKQVGYRSRIVEAFYKHVQQEVEKNGLPGIILSD